MSIIDIAVKQILNAIPGFDKEPFDQSERKGIRLDHFKQDIEVMRPSVQCILEEGEEVLGQYHPMKSPGLLELHVASLSSFFWQIAYEINQIGYYMEKADFERMAHMVVLKTYTHEQFHHFTDVARHLFGGSHDRNIEEALAVAWSHRKVQEQRNSWMSKEARLSSPFYNEMMKRMYQYTATGYREWVHYQTEADFLSALSSYLGGPQKGFLELSGIDVGRILLVILKEVENKGVIEELI